MTEGLIKVITVKGNFIVKSMNDELKHLVKVDVFGKVFLIVTHECEPGDRLTPIQGLYVALDDVIMISIIAIDHQKA